MGVTIWLLFMVGATEIRFPAGSPTFINPLSDLMAFSGIQLQTNFEYSKDSFFKKPSLKKGQHTKELFKNLLYRSVFVCVMPFHKLLTTKQIKASKTNLPFCVLV